MDDHTTETIILEYFDNIFHSNGPTDTSLLVNAIQPVVTEDINKFLTQPFTADEVHRALKQMYPKKSLGPDGMLHFFFQHFWSG